MPSATHTELNVIPLAGTEPPAPAASFDHPAGLVEQLTEQARIVPFEPTASTSAPPWPATPLRLVAVRPAGVTLAHTAPPGPFVDDLQLFEQAQSWPAPVAVVPTAKTRFESCSHSEVKFTVAGGVPVPESPFQAALAVLQPEEQTRIVPPVPTAQSGPSPLFAAIAVRLVPGAQPVTFVSFVQVEPLVVISSVQLAPTAQTCLLSITASAFRFWVVPELWPDQASVPISSPRLACMPSASASAEPVIWLRRPAV